MNRILQSTLLGLFLLAIPAAVFSAPNSITPFQDSGLPMRTDFCPVSQVWPGFDPSWIEPGTITGGGQTFYALVDPDENCTCSLGFRISTVDFFMTLPEESTYPTNILMSVGVREAVPDPSGVFSWLPGIAGCETPIRQTTVPFPKEILGFGFGLDCDCFEMEVPLSFFSPSTRIWNCPAGCSQPAVGRPVWADS